MESSHSGEDADVAEVDDGVVDDGRKLTVSRFRSPNTLEYALSFLGYFTDQFGRVLELF